MAHSSLVTAYPERVCFHCFSALERRSERVSVHNHSAKVMQFQYKFPKRSFFQVSIVGKWKKLVLPNHSETLIVSFCAAEKAVYHDCIRVRCRVLAEQMSAYMELCIPLCAGQSEAQDLNTNARVDRVFPAQLTCNFVSDWEFRDKKRSETSLPNFCIETGAKNVDLEKELNAIAVQRLLKEPIPKFEKGKAHIRSMAFESAIDLRFLSFEPLSEPTKEIARWNGYSPLEKKFYVSYLSLERERVLRECARSEFLCFQSLLTAKQSKDTEFFHNFSIAPYTPARIVSPKLFCLYPCIDTRETDTHFALRARPLPISIAVRCIGSASLSFSKPQKPMLSSRFTFLNPMRFTQISELFRETAVPKFKCAKDIDFLSDSESDDENERPKPPKWEDTDPFYGNCKLWTSHKYRKRVRKAERAELERQKMCERLSKR